MVRRPPLSSAALAAGAAVAAWHVGPAATWLPGVRAVLSPALDGRGAPGHVALTFDDGPDARSTPLFLRELERLRVRATFFVLGAFVEAHSGLVGRMAAEGHEIAVHGWGHERPWLPRPFADRAGLERAVAAVRAAGGGSPRWYRPPYGILTATRRRAARQLGLRPVLWTTWGRDWTAPADPGSVLGELAHRLTGGATVLLHDSDRTSAPGAWRVTLAALPELVSRCRAQGWTVGTLAEHGLAGESAPEPRAG
ncbi:polysaccharide deacetylase family protein [Streptomyces cacaoi]|uniref:polysaccharide deacetylase family protein n=1 Tax=Streptomyces cacaoi TaxID=1898 RepID=UPI0035306D9F